MRTEVTKCEIIHNRECLTVVYYPSKLEKFFGYKQKQKQFINSGREYMSDGLWIWYNYPEMTSHGRFEELDLFIRRKKFEKKQGK